MSGRTKRRLIGYARLTRKFQFSIAAGTLAIASGLFALFVTI